MELTHKLQGHQDRVWCVAWQPLDPQKKHGPGAIPLIASASSDKTIKIWQFSDAKDEWECIHTIEGKHTKTVRSLAWCPQGHLLASVSFDGTTCIFRGELSEETNSLEFECVQELTDHQNEVKSVAWSNGGEFPGKFLATCSRDKTIYVYQAEDDDMLISGGGEEDNFEFSVSGILQEHTQDVKFVRWHPTEDLLFSASYDNTIKCWKYDYATDDWLCSYTMQGHLSTVWQIDFDQSGKFLCSCSEDQAWSIWEISDKGYKNRGAIPNTHQRSIYSVSWAKEEITNGRHLICTGGADNRINLFEIDTEAEGDVGFKLLGAVEMAHADDVNNVEFCFRRVKENLLVASCGDDKLVNLWRVVE